MAKPPPNFLIGQQRSREKRTARARAHEALVWGELVNVAILYQPSSLREYAAILSHWGVPTARDYSRGEPFEAQWTTSHVHHHLKERGVTAKALTKRASEPRVFEARESAAELAASFRRAVDSFDAPTEENGSWLPATECQPRKTDLVRHRRHGVGQVLSKKSLAAYKCRFFTTPFERLDLICPLMDIEVYRHRLSKEERRLRTERLARRFGFLRDSSH